MRSRDVRSQPTVQIFEPFAGWHHTKYIAMLLPALQQLVDQGVLREVVLTTTDSHRATPHFRDALERFASSVRFDTFPADYQTLGGNATSSALLRSLHRNRPDFVISTSANNGALSLALRCLATSPLDNGRVSSIGILHNGFASPPTSFRDRTTDVVHRVSRYLAPWSEVGIVNPLLFDAVCAQRPWAPARVRMLPDPVEQRTPLSKVAARAALGIPVEGRYIAQIGKTDVRKAVTELLRAFRTAAPPQGVRLLFAGQLHPEHRSLIEDRFGDLVARGSIVLIDRYLTPDEFHAANCAADVVAVTYYTEELSGNLLAATAAERPVIASEKGYTGMMIARFGVGWSCDIASPSSFAEALHAAVTGSQTYALTPQTRRLLEFHRPENFAASVLQRLYRQLPVPAPDVKTWEWVSGSLPSDRPLPAQPVPLLQQR